MNTSVTSLKRVLYLVFLMIASTQAFQENNYQKVNDYESEAYQSEKYAVQKDEFEYKNELLEYACLDPSVLPQNKEGKIHLISASNKQKVESFRKGKCPPVVIIPGYIGTKLDFRITNCSLFSKHHQVIMKTCGWENCNANELKKFTVWLNMDIDVNEILSVVMGGGLNPNKNKGKKTPHIPKIIRSIKIEDGTPIEYEMKEGCLGALLRIYHKELNLSDDIESNNNLNKTGNANDTKNNSESFTKNNNKFYQVEKLKGAEITVQTTTRGECGADTISNILGNIFSVSNSFKGFNNLNNHLVKMGYVKGLSLFNVPYDFRLDIDTILAPVKRAIRIAYQINKKKVLLVSHSFGGLISLKLSGYHKESELIKHIVFVGSPFLGTNNAAIDTLTKTQSWDLENKISYFGINAVVKTRLDEASVHMIAGSFPSLQFFPKAMLNDETDSVIKSISELEKLVENKFKINHENYHMTKRIKLVFNNYLENLPNKEIVKKFYKLFPKPYKFCTSIPSKNREDVYSGICKINMADYTQNPVFTYNKKDIVLKNLLHEDNHDHSFNLFLEYFDKSIDILNEHAAHDYKINKEKYIKHVLHSQEKDIFKEFKRNENIEYSFVYSNHLKTLEYVEFEEAKGKMMKKNMRFTDGDGTITGFSQIYPGLRWLIQDLKSEDEGKSNGKLNFVEYCALKPKSKKTEENGNNDRSKNKVDNADANAYDKNTKLQYLSIKCDCMTSTNLDPNGNCNHAAMINDSHFLNYISDAIIGSENKEYLSENFKDLYEIKFEDRMKCGNMFSK